MGLADRLESYEVTTVPLPAPRLRLVWSAPDDDVAAGADDGGDDETVTRLLSAYRITLVPGRSAS